MIVACTTRDDHQERSCGRVGTLRSGSYTFCAGGERTEQRCSVERYPALRRSEARMFVRMTPLDATRDPRSLVPVTPVDADGCAWFAIVDSVKPVHPDNGDPDRADLRAREARAFRSGGMRTYASGGYLIVAQERTGHQLAHSAPWYTAQNVSINTCYPCLGAIRYA